MFFVILISLVLAISAFDEEYRYVDTLTGKVRATRTPSSLKDLSNNMYPFLGIPYAKPPLGELRFQKPQPAEPWEGTLEADELPSACPQYSSYPYPWYDQNPDGKSEDCLYLNVYAPNDDRFSNPVIFFIHGGGFQVGSSRMKNYNGEVIATDLNPVKRREYLSQPAVFVTFNYRLGALGFLTSGTDDAPGNAGFQDMLLALNWVKANIRAFGGNPELITLMGQGSGAIAVSLMLVSPLTKGLFQRAILTSGSFVSHRENSFQKNLQVSERLAEVVGCTSENMTFNDHPKDVVTCLQGVDANELAVALNSLDPEDNMMLYPVYDGELLPSDPVKSLIDGEAHNVPIIMGFSASEGSYLLTNMYPEVFGRFGEKEQGINITFAKSIFYEAFKSKYNLAGITHRYLAGINKSDESKILRRTYEAMGDDKIICPAALFGQLYADHFGRVFFFEFDFPLTPRMPWAKWMRSVHYNDIPYLLGVLMPEVSKDMPYEQRAIMLLLRVQVVRFAIDGSVMNTPWIDHKYHRGHQSVAEFNDYIAGTADRYSFGNTVRCDYYRTAKIGIK